MHIQTIWENKFLGKTLIRVVFLYLIGLETGLWIEKENVVFTVNTLKVSLKKSFKIYLTIRYEIVISNTNMKSNKLIKLNRSSQFFLMSCCYNLL